MKKGVSENGGRTIFLQIAIVIRKTAWLKCGKPWFFDFPLAYVDGRHGRAAVASLRYEGPSGKAAGLPCLRSGRRSRAARRTSETRHAPGWHRTTLLLAHLRQGVHQEWCGQAIPAGWSVREVFQSTESSLCHAADNIYQDDCQRLHARC